MRRYLLGDLPESETNELELQVLRDDDAFEELWETENRLVDGYVRGRLSSAEQEKFERHYQASPVHRHRVAVARNLVEEADSSAATAISPAKVSWSTRLSEKLGFSILSWQSALAAAMLLFAMSSLWLFLERSRLRHEREQLSADTQSRQNREAALSQQLATAQDESKRLESEIERLRAERNTNVLPEPEPTPRPTVYSLLLSPMLMRSGDSPQTAVIPAQASVVRLQLKVDQQDASSFQVSVRTVEGRQVWDQKLRRRTGQAAASTISAQIPVSKLPRGDYILTLSAINLTGQPEEVNRYFFRVIGQ